VQLTAARSGDIGDAPKEAQKKNPTLRGARANKVTAAYKRGSERGIDARATRGDQPSFQESEKKKLKPTPMTADIMKNPGSEKHATKSCGSQDNPETSPGTGKKESQKGLGDKYTASGNGVLEQKMKKSGNLRTTLSVRQRAGEASRKKYR